MAFKTARLRAAAALFLFGRPDVAGAAVSLDERRAKTRLLPVLRPPTLFDWPTNGAARQSLPLGFPWTHVFFAAACLR